MKFQNNLLGVLALMMAFGAGCAARPTDIGSGVLTQSPSAVSTEGVSTVPNVVPTSTDPYAQWAIQFPKNSLPLIDTYQKTDCAGLANGESYGGDLLSSLIVDQSVRDLLKIRVYSIPYLKHLEKRIAEHVQQRAASDFYAFSVCHVGAFDVSAGYLWPHGKPTHVSGGKFDGEVDMAFTSSSTLVIVTPNGVHMFSGIQLESNTATGGETSPCRASAVDDSHIQWACFRGLHRIPNTDDLDGRSDMQYWLLPLNGGAVKTWSEVE